MWRDNLITDAPLARCPLRSLQLAAATAPELVAEMGRYLETYEPAYAEGFLLEEGGIADQSARYLDVMRLIRAFRDAAQRKFDEIQEQNGE